MAKNLVLAVHFSGPIPREIHTDPLRLRQVLMNLVGNAIKFTENGQIDVIVSARKMDGAGRLQIEIRDTGIGMTPEQMGRLFQPFVQADESMSRKYGGSGLGLVISKRLAKLMGGDVVVSSTSGKGSTFVVWVDTGPLDQTEWMTGMTESMLQPIGNNEVSEQIQLTGKILLAEDGYDNQQLISLYLTSAGAEVTIAENGRIAVEKVRGGKFDVVLMDMQMPELDGYGATSELRRRGFDLPIIALTAHAMTGDRARCISAGCTDYLTKPVDAELLLRTVRSYIRNSAGHEAVASTPPAGTATSSQTPATMAFAASQPPQANAPAAQPNRITPVPSVMPRSERASQAMQQAITGFIDRLPDRVDSINRFFSTGELDELKRALHQLKGAGAGYGFPTITELAARAEQTVATRAAMEQIKTEVDSLVGLIRRVEGYNVDRESYAKPEAAGH